MHTCRYDGAGSLLMQENKIILLFYKKKNIFFPRSKNLNKPKNNCHASIAKRSRTKHLHLTYHQGRPPEAY
jgi:hypothetical protein